MYSQEPISRFSASKLFQKPVLICVNPCLFSSTLVENPPQIAHTFVQNKPNFPDDQMYLTAFYTKEYENRPTSTLDGNKANTKPNKPNLHKAQTSVTFFTTNAYGNELRTTNNEHSCKTNPIKPNSYLSSLTFCQSSSASSFTPAPLTAEMA